MNRPKYCPTDGKMSNSRLFLGHALTLKLILLKIIKCSTGVHGWTVWLSTYFPFLFWMEHVFLWEIGELQLPYSVLCPYYIFFLFFPLVLWHCLSFILPLPWFISHPVWCEHISDIIQKEKGTQKTWTNIIFLYEKYASKLSEDPVRYVFVEIFCGGWVIFRNIFEFNFFSILIKL